MKRIPKFPKYTITKTGKVYSKRSKQFLKLMLGSLGYLEVSLYKDQKQTVCRVHRLVLETFTGPCPKGMECRHLDGIRTNNNISNLVWGTRKENVADKRLHGTACNLPRGEQNNKAKLNTIQVREIRRIYEEGFFTQTLLGEMYGVCHSTIGRIIRDKTWRHVP